MSRVSSKSSLSPSATGRSAIDLSKGNNIDLSKGNNIDLSKGNNIDLSKGDGVDMGGKIDMGRKTQPSVTSGGIGVTQEVGNIGGLTVTGGVSVEVSPLSINVSGDPSNNTISIAGSAELPGGILGISGGTTIDTNTGEIIGGSIGGEIGGFGINVSSDKGDLGIEFTYQIPFTPIEISIGLGSTKKEPTPTPTPAPAPAPTPAPTPGTLPPPPLPPKLSCTKNWRTYNIEFYYVVENTSYYDANKGYYTVLREDRHTLLYNDSFKSLHSDTSDSNLAKIYGTNTTNYTAQLNNAQIRYFNSRYDITNETATDFYNAPVEMRVEGAHYTVRSGSTIIFYNIGYKELRYRRETIGYTTNNKPIFGEWLLISESEYRLVCGDDALSSPSPSPAPFPNPPPRKRNMDECCRDSLKLLREIKRFEQETMILLGRPLNSKGDLGPLPPGTKFFGEEIERIKTPIKDINKPEKEKIKFSNFYQLQMYLLGQQINLDVGVDPKSFIAPAGFVQNPDYERHSESSLESNIQPKSDQAGNNRQLEIGEDIYINSLFGQQ